MRSTLTRQPESFRDLWELVLAAGLTLLLVGLLLWLLVSPGVIKLGSTGAIFEPMANTSQTAFTEETGLRIVRVYSTAGGGMIDVRYQVVDPDKAILIHDLENPPALVNETTGQMINRPYHDHSSQTELHTGVTYNELLINQGGVIKPGDLVTLSVGAVRLEHILVQ
jgi:hypothetical protein